MKYFPLVSIIIPVYNVEDYIEASLKSALNQSYSNVEIILVNDCTLDNSMQICNKIGRSPEYKSKRIKILNLKINGGLSNARNEGLRIANGEYIFFMDSDDTITDDCIKFHVENILKFNADFSDGNVRMIGANHSNFTPYNKVSIIENSEVLKSYFRTLHVCGWNKLIRRDFLVDNSILFRRGMLYEDMLWTYQICKKAKKFVTVPSETYFYLIRQGSITTQNKDTNHAFKQFWSFIELLQCMRNEFQSPSNNELMKLQSKWMNKILFIVKTRLLNAPLCRNDKIHFFNEMKSFAELTPGLFKFIHKLSYTIFSFIFFMPNKIFRKLR